MFTIFDLTNNIAVKASIHIHYGIISMFSINCMQLILICSFMQQQFIPLPGVAP